MDRSHVKGILPQRLEDYMREAQNDLKVDQINIKDKVLLRSSLGAKWCRYSFEEQRYKKKILDQIDKLREQFKQKIFNQKKTALINNNINNNAIDKLISLDAQKLLINDVTYKKWKQALNMQEDILRLINEIQKQISMLSYDLMNCKQILKMEMI